MSMLPPSFIYFMCIVVTFFSYHQFACHKLTSLFSKNVDSWLHRNLLHVIILLQLKDKDGRNNPVDFSVCFNLFL